MIILLYSALFSYMLFFSACIAPLITTTLDKKNSSKLLRKIFPRNFYYGLFISLFLLTVSFYFQNIPSKKFKILHMYSVLLYLTQMILSLAMLVKETIF